MPKLTYLSLCALPLAAACDDDPITPAEITISTVRAPEAIAFRDGLDGEWRTPAPTATGSYKLDVSGPYVVSVVCKAGGDFLVTTRQIARTPEDGRELDLPCEELPEANATVTGTMVQPGYLGLAGALGFSATPDWDFSFAIPAGTFDLIGVSDQKIALRRDLAVSGTMDLGTIDLDQEGAALVPVALTAPNAATAEMLEAQVSLTTPRTDEGHVHVGAPATAKVAPAELLTAGVRQSVAMVAWSDDANRMVRRDFKAGDATAFTLPEPLGAIQFDTATGALVATWSTLPEHDRILMAVHGSAADDKARGHELEVSQRFVAATGATSLKLDTDVPGFQADWRPDFSREYLRELSVVRERNGEHASSNVFKLVNAEEARQSVRPRGPARAGHRLAR